MTKHMVAKPGSLAESREFLFVIAGIAIIDVAYVLSQIYDVANVANSLFTIGGINVYPYDIASVLLGALATFRFVRRRQFARIELIFGALLVISLVQFARSFAANGFPAGVEFRKDAILLFGVFFMLESSPQYTRRHLVGILAAFSSAALLVYFGHVSGLIHASAYTQIYNLTTFREGRYIGPDEALIFFDISLVCISLAIRFVDLRIFVAYWTLTFATFIFSVILLYRSVWVAGTFGLFLLLILQLRFRLTTFGTGLLLFGGILLLIGGVAVAVATNPNVQAGIAEIFSSDSSLNWRVEGWQYMLSEMSWADVLLGRGYGADYSRVVGSEWIVNGAHNFFIEKLWQVGIFGLSLYIILYYSVLVTLVRIAKRPRNLEDRALAVILMALIGGELVYSMSYTSWMPTILGFGYALSFVRQRYPRLGASFRKSIPRFKAAPGVPRPTG